MTGRLNKRNKWKTVARPGSGEGIPCCEHYEVAVVASVSAADVNHRPGFVSLIFWPSGAYEQEFSHSGG